MIGKIDVHRTGSRTAPGGPWAGVVVRGSTCSFFTRGKNRHPFLPPAVASVCSKVCLTFLSSFLQVISLRDQIKRRQQGVDGGKDVREGFTHVGSSRFCVCVCAQKVSREVDVWVVLCVVILSPLWDFHTLSSPPSYSVFPILSSF